MPSKATARAINGVRVRMFGMGLAAVDGMGLFDHRERYTCADWRLAMATSVALSEAREHLGELLDRAESGEEILIERAGRRGVRLVADPAPQTHAGRRIGGQNLLGITYLAPDFDEPMSEEELKEWGY